jgi:di/tricarboxylate transporter
MVYGIGNYRFTDFTRLGLPLNLVSVALSLLLIPIAFPF